MPGAAGSGAGARATLADRDLEAALARDGHVTVPLLGAAAVDDLRAVYASIFPGPVSGFLPTAAYASTAQRSATTAAVYERLVPRLLPLFDRHRPFLASFLVKAPGEAGVVPLHQDDWHVDERRFRAVAVWIALDDIGPDEANGPLEVVAGSHRLERRPRGTGTSWPYAAVGDHLAEHHLVPLAARRGDAIVLDNGVVHGSPANRSDGLRLAVAVGMAPEEAGLVQAAADEHGEVWLFDVDPSFYVEEDLKALSVAASPPATRAASGCRRPRRRCRPRSSPDSAPRGVAPPAPDGRRRSDCARDGPGRYASGRCRPTSRPTTSSW